MSDRECPLCHKQRRAKKFKPLYGAPVCHKCYYAFANRRQVGYLIDWALFFVLIYLLRVQVIDPALDSPVVSATVNLTISGVLGWIVIPFIFTFKDGFAGHSPGKFVMGVRCMDQRTFEPIKPIASMKRNLILMVPFAPLVIALLLQKGYRIGDGWARSKVIWKKYARHPVFTGTLACEYCQYDLTGNTTGICPECGERIIGFTLVHRCAECDYDLTGNTTGVCPECGAAAAPPLANV